MSKGSAGINVSEDRRQRASYLLRDVDYRIYAKMVYIPVRDRSASCQKHYKEVYSEAERKAENPRKYQEIFERRAKACLLYTSRCV